MKKLKQVMLSDICKKSTENKNHSFSKAYGIWKSKTAAKKIKENLQKQSKHLDESKQKSSRSPLKSAKTNVPKMNKRSKSLIYDKKPHMKIQTTHNSSELAEEFKFLKKEEKLQEKDLDFFSSNGESKVQKDFSSVEDHSPYFNKDKIDCSTQYKEILIVDAQIQCQEFRIEEERKTKALISEFQQEKSKFRLDLGVLQQKMQLILLEAQERQNQNRSIHLQQVHELRVGIEKLKEINQQVLLEKQNLKEIIKKKQNQIQTLLNNEKALQQKLKEEQTENQRISNINQLLKKEVSFYREEMKSFEENLSDFQKMKGIYEKRLDCLERQKIKIKNHAKQLLVMVEIYKKKEEEKD